MYLVKTPQVIQNLFPNFTWRIPSAEKVLYLTFDDGPVPEVTPWVLEELAAFDAKATFFCVGDNIRKHPEVFQQVIDEGHSVGNHTFNHLNGWASDNISYFHNIRHCARQMDSVLFRPPYGRMKPKQVQFLQRHYRIIMWDVLSGDFDQNITGEQCFANVVNNARPGSIIVFHDSLKAEGRLSDVLPRVLKHYAEQGYRFERLNEKELVRETDLLKSA
jgi:peptidoglycan/xylan/chitin deacetylase (PgdA/CDA1 family)